jgi:hypothetical protein
MRRGAVAGAVLGALPGVWLAVRGAARTHAAGASTAEVAGVLGIGLGLVAAAGILLGAVAGGGAGFLWDVLRTRASERERRAPR